MNMLTKVLVLGTLCLWGGVCAFADSLPAPLLSSDTPYSSLVFVRGGSLTSTTMMTTAPGTVTVKLSDLTWPTALGTLSFSLSNSTSQLHTTSGPGTWSWTVDTPTLLYASVYAVASGAKNAGLYGLDISFVPSQSPEQAPVPLPTALSMLLSGAAMLFAYRRKHMFVTQGGLTAA